MIPTKKLFIMTLMSLSFVAASCEAVYGDGTVEIKKDGTYICVDK